MNSDAVQYLTDDRGNKTAVVVPIERWKEVFEFYDQYHRLKTSIHQGFQDIANMTEKEKASQDVQAFLDEL